MNLHWVTTWLLVLGATLAISEQNALLCLLPYVLAAVNQYIAGWAVTGPEPEDVPYE